MNAIVNVTWAGNNGDLEDPVDFTAPDSSILAWVTEAIRSGAVRGIPADTTVTLVNFQVDRFNPTADRDYPLISVRPKVPFGG